MIRAHKKNLLAVIMILIFRQIEINGQVGINTTGAEPALNAMLDIASTNKGLLIPRVSTINRNALSGEGMVVFDTDTKTFWFHNGTVWVNNWINSGTNIYNSNTGNVGIGTNTPAAKLDINGSLKYTNGTQANGKVLTSDPAGNANWIDLPVASGFPLNIPEIVNWKGVFGAATTYNVNELVSSTTPNVYYYSKANSNLNHTPESSPSFWQAVDFYQLKQIFKALPLSAAQTINLFSLPDQYFSLQGKLRYSFSIEYLGPTGFCGSIGEIDFVNIKSNLGNYTAAYQNVNTKFAVGFSGPTVSANFSTNGTIYGFAFLATLPAGQTISSNGIYFNIIPLGAQFNGNPIDKIHINLLP